MDKIELENLYDIAILRHGFADYNRDYEFIIEIGGQINAGQFLLVFKNVYELTYKTTLPYKVIRQSLHDDFTNYQKWQDNGEKEGFVWEVNYSLAYPGFTIKDNSDNAIKWTKELGINMYEIILDTNTYKIEFLSSAFELKKINDKHDLADQIFLPIK